MMGQFWPALAKVAEGGRRKRSLTLFLLLLETAPSSPITPIILELVVSLAYRRSQSQENVAMINSDDRSLHPAMTANE
jgi:hypothetical protein